MLTGRFDVLELERNAKGVHTRVAINFEQHSTVSTPQLFGKFRYTKPAPLANTAPDLQGRTWFSFHSQPGEFVGRGQTQSYLAPETDFSVSRNFHNGVDFYVGGWGFSFAAPNDEVITPGVYLDATRFPFQDIDEPGLTMSGDGRGYNESVGHFQVFDAAYDEMGNVLRFSADFEMRGSWADAALLGKIRYNVIPEPASCAITAMALVVFRLQRALAQCRLVKRTT